MITAKSGSDYTIGFPRIEQRLFEQLFHSIGPAPIRFVLPDGKEASPAGKSPVGTVFIHDNRTLAKLIIDPEMAFGEAYVEGRVHVEGDLVRLLEEVYQSMGTSPEGKYERLTSKLLNWWQANTPNGSRNNIHHHYDLGNDFYKLWLDPQMIYTCAYFASPDATLEEAQEVKLDYICRKLQLRPGETVVEAGCGWGALAMHMAQHYGVTVKAFNISREQVLFARRAAEERGLSDQVEFIEDDYRSISQRCDAFVSVGMLEHVDPKRFVDFGEVIYRAIGDKGRGLLHFVGRSHAGNFSRWIRKRIFPGAHAPSLAEAMNILQPRHYAVLDVENLRPHYARTLEHWLDRFEASSPRVIEMYGAWFQRAWRLYLAGSIAGFRAGTLQLFQITFAGAKRHSNSWTRAPLYAETATLREEVCLRH